MTETVVIAGALAQKPRHSGHSWVLLQYLLSFKRLGWDVLFLDRLEPGMCFTAAGRPCPLDQSLNLRYALGVIESFGLSDSFALVYDGGERFVGLSRQEVLERVAPESDWCDYVHSRVGDTFPFQLVAGNHEDDFGEDGHISEFAACLPDRMDSVGEYPEEYYFDYRGPARFIMISSDLTIDGEHYFYGDSNKHYDSVEDVIDDARASDIPWVIVGMHKNCLSVGEYYCNIYQELMSLLVEKKVGLVFQAHDHTYQRTRQLDTGPSCAIVKVDSFDDDCVVDSGEDDAYTKLAGPVFVITGAAGADLYDINSNDPEARYFVKWMGKNCDPRKGFTKFAVSRGEISAAFVGSTSTSDFTDRFAIRAQ